MGFEFTRIGVWNCQNGLKSPEQIEQLKSLKLDIVVVPELRQDDIAHLGVSDSLWVTNNHAQRSPKGLGVLAFGDWSLAPLPRDEEMEIFLPVTAQNGRIGFTLLAVWNFYYAAKQGRFKNATGEDAVEYAVLEKYRDLMSGRFVMAGDFNFGPTYSQKSFVDYCQRLERRHVQSLYHKYFKISHGSSKHATFRHSSGSLHHLDHIFASKDLANSMQSFEVMDIA